MGPPGKRQGVKKIQFLRGKGRGGNLQQHGAGRAGAPLSAQRLHGAGAHLVHLPLQQERSLYQQRGLSQNIFMRRQADDFFPMCAAFCLQAFQRLHLAHADHPCRTGNSGQRRRDFLPGQNVGGIHKIRRAGLIQTAGDIQQCGFPHTIHKHVKLGVRQERLAQAVRPEIIVADAP